MTADFAWDGKEFTNAGSENAGLAPILTTALGSGAALPVQARGLLSPATGAKPCSSAAECPNILAFTGRYLISESTRQDILGLYRVPVDRVDRVYYGLDPSFHPLPRDQVSEFRAQRGLPDRFLLFVGTLEPRKNVAGLLAAYRVTSLLERFSLGLLSRYTPRRVGVLRALARAGEGAGQEALRTLAAEEQDQNLRMRIAEAQHAAHAGGKS